MNITCTITWCNIEMCFFKLCPGCLLIRILLPRNNFCFYGIYPIECQTLLHTSSLLSSMFGWNIQPSLCTVGGKKLYLVSWYQVIFTQQVMKCNSGSVVWDEVVVGSCNLYVFAWRGKHTYTLRQIHVYSLKLNKETNAFTRVGTCVCLKPYIWTVLYL